MLLREQGLSDKQRLHDQWLADVKSLNVMVEKMLFEIEEMQKANAPEKHILLRQEMIAQYETTISKLESLIKTS